MINIQKICFKYVGSKVSIFDDFSLQLQSSRVYGLLGPNGAGKSTLLYLMTGLLRPQRGCVLVDGVNVAKRRAATLADLYLVPEEYELPRMTLNEYVRSYSPFYPRFSKEVMTRCLAEFELTSDLDLHRLSMGQKKKVVIAFALAAGTRYLLMDEPTNGLDIPSKRQFRRVIASCMDDERLILISTHQIHDVEQLLDHVLILSDGRTFCDAATSELTRRFSFTHAAVAPSTALYTERTAQGYVSISPRTDEEETTMNLELLYNAVTTKQIQL